MPRYIGDEVITMDREILPVPTFSREELIHIQSILDEERRFWFNKKMDQLWNGEDTTETEEKYQLSKILRNKVYHLGGRDTLALSKGYEEQRWWDQRHNY